MAALDFPSSPTTGQVYTANGKSWAYDGTTWVIQSGFPAASFVGCRVYNAGTQSISTATATALTFNSEYFDTGGLHSTSVNTSRVTIAQSGYYDLAAGTTLDANSTGLRSLRFTVNGSDLNAGFLQVMPVTTGSALILATAALGIYLNAGDYVETVVYQNSGSTLAYGSASGAGMSYLSAYKVDGIVGGGTPSGTSFPATPGTGQQFFRTDLGLECYYDGTRWLTKTEYPLVLRSDIPLSITNSGENLRAEVDTTQSNMWLTRVTLSMYVVTTNTGSHYWTAQFASQNVSASPTSIGSLQSTADSTVNNWVSYPITIGAALGAGAKTFALTLTKVGSPGSLYALSTLYYRLIVT